MISPLGFEFSTRIDSPAETDVLALVDAWVRKHDGVTLERTSTRLTFDAPFNWLGGNWRLFVPIDRGEFIVSAESDGRRLVARFSVRRLLLIASVMSVVAGLLTAIGEGPKTGFTVTGFFWCLLFGANYIISFLRFNLEVNDLASSTSVPGQAA